MYEEALYSQELIPPKMRRSSNESGQQKSSSDFKIEHHRRSSSNDNFVQKVDNLNIEELLEGEDEEELSQLEFTGNQFSGQLDQQFLKEFNKEIHSKALLQNEEDNDMSSLNSGNIDQMLAKEESKSSKQSENSEHLDDVPNEKSFASSQKIETDLMVMKPVIELPCITKESVTTTSKSPSMNIQTTFSPQNLVAKLLSSLNKKSDDAEKVNDMFICDNFDNPPESKA